MEAVEKAPPRRQAKGARNEQGKEYYFDGGLPSEETGPSTNGGQLGEEGFPNRMRDELAASGISEEHAGKFGFRPITVRNDRRCR